jgi:non-ribosomal peptide synthetase component E (peptide arylation enzyme)
VAEYTAKGYWSDVTVGERLDRMVTAYPNKTAIVDARQRVTYGEFSRLVNHLAQGLHSLGIKRGDRVTAQLPNRVEALALYFAVAKIGAVLCPVVPYYRAAEVRYILERSDSVAIIVPDTFGGFDYLNMIQEIRPSLPTLQHVIVVGERVPAGMVSFRELVAGQRKAEPSPAQAAAVRWGFPSQGTSPAAQLAALRPDANGPLALMFTSGTEAAPKAPIWTHNTIHNCMVYNSGWGFTESDVLLCLAPAYHAFGLAVGCHVILAEVGATCVWMDAFDPEEALRLVEQERATVVVGVPPQLMAILNHPNLKRYDLSSLRIFNTAAAPMPAEGIRRLRAEVGCGFVTLWGASESVGGPITRVDDPPELAATTVGRPATEAVEIVVFDERREKILPAGQMGEMAIRGPFVHVGYFKDPELTRQSFHPDGWFFTGDSVVMDERGYITFVSRIKDIINRGGEKISPREVEEYLYAHPKVLAVAMVGMPDPRLGERNCVYIVPRPGETITLEEIVSFLQERGLAKVKLPERLEVVDNLPLTASGKVRKNVLRQDIARRLQEGS